MSASRSGMSADEFQAHRVADAMYEVIRQQQTGNAPPLDAAPTPAPPPATTTTEVERQRAVSGPPLPDGPVLTLDTNCIGRNPFVSRLPFNWKDKEFDTLKQSIKSDGSNAEPIKVRPAPSGSSGKFQVVCGQRRLQACADLGVPVRVIVEQLSDLDMVTQMYMSNELRTDWTPYEKGLLCIAAIKAGLYKTHIELASKIGLDDSTVSKHVKLATLPESVVDAFRSPAKLQVNWGAALHKALSADRERVLMCAARIHATGKPTNAKHVFDELRGVEPLPVATALRREILVRKRGRSWARIDAPVSALGEGVRVHFEPGAVDVDALEAAIRKLAVMK